MKKIVAAWVKCPNTNVGVQVRPNIDGLAICPRCGDDHRRLWDEVVAKYTDDDEQRLMKKFGVRK
jgi:hypothetical protein